MIVVDVRKDTVTTSTSLSNLPLRHTIIVCVVGHHEEVAAQSTNHMELGVVEQGGGSGGIILQGAVFSYLRYCKLRNQIFLK